MLHNFLVENRTEIDDRVAQRLRARESRLGGSTPSLELSQFLGQVSVSLRHQPDQPASGTSEIGVTAARHGANLMRAGKPASEAVEAYADVCQAVTGLAIEQHVAISTSDFYVFNRCLDDAIGGAVGEHARITEEVRAADELQRLGHAAHEMRDQLQTARLSFEALKRTTALLDHPSANLLGRSLVNLTKLIERTLADVRLAAGVERREPLQLDAFLSEVAASAQMHADSRGLIVVVKSTTQGTIEADPQLLMSAVMNLVHNALKFTSPGSTVAVMANIQSGRLILSVEDQCGGIPDHAGELFRAFDDRRGVDRTGLGLGLSIARRVVRSHHGDIEVRNRPGVGCVFTIDMPALAPLPRPTTRAEAT